MLLVPNVSLSVYSPRVLCPRLVLLGEPSLCCLVGVVVSFADPRVRSLPSAELVVVRDPAPFMVLKGRAGRAVLA